MHTHTDPGPEHPDRVLAADHSSAWMDATMRDLAACPPGPRRQALRDAAILALLPLARRVARRFQGHGEQFEDLVQVASLGLVRAVDGFVPSRGHAFLSYALPTVVGEVRRHLRDRVPVIRLPRPLQEACGPVLQALEELEQRYGGVAPGAEKIAAHLGMETALVSATLRALRECRPVSLDAPAIGREAHTAVCGTGLEHRGVDHVVDVMTLASAVRRLTALERRILHLRFYQEQSQQQIAAAVGLSQGQVSRVVAHCCRRLGRALQAGSTGPAGGVPDRRQTVTAGQERLAPGPRQVPPLRPCQGSPRAEPDTGAVRWEASAGRPPTAGSAGRP
ncbi:sigma-70 family RNA polymerase sigma factor [Streptomyces sp. NK08204]|uniref:sigma-70 family RNA polymerase sigma factor n=1 Tax=Streptomyces sp. NK08204 TaxID=2873260 RepID=UPI001CED2B80|nr:sigma-70 family RNA polymerase sigma factor [Streptomyces sp. NK08204]